MEHEMQRSMKNCVIICTAVWLFVVLLLNNTAFALSKEMPQASYFALMIIFNFVHIILGLFIMSARERYLQLKERFSGWRLCFDMLLMCVGIAVVVLFAVVVLVPPFGTPAPIKCSDDDIAARVAEGRVVAISPTLINTQVNGTSGGVLAMALNVSQNVNISGVFLVAPNAAIIHSSRDGNVWLQLATLDVDTQRAIYDLRLKHPLALSPEVVIAIRQSQTLEIYDDKVIQARKYVIATNVLSVTAACMALLPLLPK